MLPNDWINAAGAATPESCTQSSSVARRISNVSRCNCPSSPRSCSSAARLRSICSLRRATARRVLVQLGQHPRPLGVETLSAHRLLRGRSLAGGRRAALAISASPLTVRPAAPPRLRSASARVELFGGLLHGLFAADLLLVGRLVLLLQFGHTLAQPKPRGLQSFSNWASRAFNSASR